MIEGNDAQNHIRKKIDDNISGFSSKHKSNRKKAFYLKLTIAISLGITTLLVGFQGLSEAHKNLLLNISLFFSLLATLLGTIDSFYDYRALWVRYTQTLNDLYEIKSDFELTLALQKTLSDPEIKAFDAKIQNILKGTNEWWHSKRTTANNTQNKDVGG